MESAVVPTRSLSRIQVCPERSAVPTELQCLTALVNVAIPVSRRQAFLVAKCCLDAFRTLDVIVVGVQGDKLIYLFSSGGRDWSAVLFVPREGVRVIVFAAESATIPDGLYHARVGGKVPTLNGKARAMRHVDQRMDKCNE
jgi:hypothetical protein